MPDANPGPIPVRGNYTDVADYAFQLFAWLRDYIDARNKHRQAAIDMQANAVARHEAALIRDAANPGWVKVELDAQAEDIGVLVEAIKAQNRKLNAIFVTLFSTLVTLLTILVSILAGALGGN